MNDIRYSFHTPANLLFGEGIIKEIPKQLEIKKHKKILVVTDKNLVQTGIPARVVELVEQAGIEVFLFDSVQQNPTQKNVEDGCAMVLDKQCDAVMAVGGGSPIDASKAMSMLAVHGGSITEYEYGLKPITKKGPSIYLIPTTAGTGSEATFWSVITDESTHRKFDIGSPFMASDISFIDPELTYGLPASVTAATGMDALCHAMETLVTKNRWNATAALAIEAIGLIARNILTAYREPQNKDARRNVMLGSMIAGMSFPNGGLGAVHGLTAPLGGHFGVPHGVANAIMLPFVMEYNLSAVEELYAGAALAMGCSKPSGQAAVDSVKEMNKELDIPTLANFNIREEDLLKIAHDALGRNSNCDSNPVPVTEKDAVDMLRKGLK